MLRNLSLVLLCTSILAVNTASAQSLGDTTMTYDSCLEKADGSDQKMTSCTVIEANRILKIVERKYDRLANNETFKLWNQGAGMYSGNFKDLYSKWLQYRDKYCSLYGYSLSPDRDNGSIAELSGAECVLELTKRQNKDMDVILKNSEQ